MVPVAGVGGRRSTICVHNNRCCKQPCVQRRGTHGAEHIPMASKVRPRPRLSAGECITPDNSLPSSHSSRSLFMPCPGAPQEAGSVPLSPMLRRYLQAGTWLGRERGWGSNPGPLLGVLCCRLSRRAA